MLKVLAVMIHVMLASLFVALAMLVGSDFPDAFQIFFFLGGLSIYGILVYLHAKWGNDY